MASKVELPDEVQKAIIQQYFGETKVPMMKLTLEYVNKHAVKASAIVKNIIHDEKRKRGISYARRPKA